MATKEDILKESGAETATYIDENGERKTGTVLRGYIDAAADADYYGAQSDLYKDMLDTQQKANQSAADAAANEALINAQQQTEKVNTAYGASDKELFRGYKKAVRDLPQQLAAMGATGGLSETSRVELETGYGENLNKSQLQRMAEIAELTAAADAAKRQAQAAADQQNAAALQNYYSAIAGLGDQKYQEKLADQRLQDERAYAERQLLDEREYAERQLLNEREYVAEREAAELKRARAEQSAEILASIGDFSGYVDLGLMTEDNAALAKKAWIAENPELAERLGYVSSPKAKTPYYYDDDGGEYGDFDKLTPVQQYIAERAAEEVINGNSDWIESFEKNDDFSSKDKEAATAYLKKEGIL